VRAFTFNMDGTLADTMPCYQMPWQTMLHELRLTVDHHELFTSTVASIDDLNDPALHALFH
jgi:beta-phosphoglucomutase-like phosphatase (HAD superfamily)